MPINGLVKKMKGLWKQSLFKQFGKDRALCGIPGFAEEKELSDFWGSINNITMNNYENVQSILRHLFNSDENQRTTNYIYDYKQTLWVPYAHNCRFLGFSEENRFTGKFGLEFKCDDKKNVYCKSQVVPGNNPDSTNPKYAFLYGITDQKNIRGAYLSAENKNNCELKTHEIFLLKNPVRFGELLRKIKDWKYSEVYEMFPNHVPKSL